MRRLNNQLVLFTDNKTAPRRINGLLGQQVKVEDGGAMNLSIKDSPKPEVTKINGVHSNGIPLHLRTNNGLPFMINTDSKGTY